MKLSRDYMLTTQAGSLPLPPSPVWVSGQRLIGAGEGDEVDDLCREAVVEVVRRQHAVGIEIVSDGGLSTPSFANYAADRLTGFEPAVDRVKDRGLAGDGPRCAGCALRAGTSYAACVGDVNYRGTPELDRGIVNLRAAVAVITVGQGFLSSPSPGAIALGHPNHHYASDEQYVGALADALKVEYDSIYEGGFVLQLECPDLAVSPGDEARRQLAIEALNHATRDVPPEALRLHVCTGDGDAERDADVSLKRVIGSVLRARGGAIYLPAATARRIHQWRVFEEVVLPDDKTLIVGVIDSSTSRVEDPRVVADRIARYVHVVGRERVIAGTDCGFPTVPQSADVEDQIAWAKLQALADGARIVSRELW